MDSALWAAKTGLDAQQTRMTVTANNLANVNTTGFKKSRAVFEDLVYQNIRQVGASTSQDTQSPTGLSLGTGARVVAHAEADPANAERLERPLRVLPGDHSTPRVGKARRYVKGVLYEH